MRFQPNLTSVHLGAVRAKRRKQGRRQKKSANLMMHVVSLLFSQGLKHEGCEPRQHAYAERAIPYDINRPLPVEMEPFINCCDPVSFASILHLACARKEAHPPFVRHTGVFQKYRLLYPRRAYMPVASRWTYQTHKEAWK